VEKEVTCKNFVIAYTHILKETNNGTYKRMIDVNPGETTTTTDLSHLVLIPKIGIITIDNKTYIKRRNA
jgi:hypothetical protein